MTATETAAHAEPERPEPVRPGTERRERRATALRYGAVAALGALVVLRFVAHSHLWLDEALSVDIARLPLRDLPGALRHDGSPPLYYALLHLWMRAFGEGTIAVRALSGVCLHRGGPLGQGQIHAGHVVCPYHLWEFDCATGAYDYDPTKRVPTFEVKVEDGDILLQVP